MENEALENWSNFYEGLNEEYRKETGNQRIDISRADMIRFIAWLRTKLYEAREGKTFPDTISGLHKHSVKHRCLHCEKPIIFDNYSASWIHKREWKGTDNGYYCDNDKPDIKFTATPNNGV